MEQVSTHILSELKYCIFTITREIKDYNSHTDVIDTAITLLKNQNKEIADLSADTVPEQTLESLANGSQITVNISGDVTINNSIVEPEPPIETFRDCVADFASDIDMIIDANAPSEEEVKTEFWLNENPHKYKEQLIQKVRLLRNELNQDEDSLFDYSSVLIRNLCAEIGACAFFISDKKGKLRSENND